MNSWPGLNVVCVEAKTHKTEEQWSETADNFHHSCSIGESQKMTPGEENRET
jgi:hypothetical protein